MEKLFCYYRKREEYWLREREIQEIRIIGFKVRFAIERFYIRWKSNDVVSGYSRLIGGEAVTSLDHRLSNRFFA